MTTPSEAVQAFERFLTRSRVNLGKDTPGRKRFIATAVAMFKAATGVGAEPEPTPATPKADRILRITSAAQLGPGGATMMTASESMKADESLGRSPFVGGGNK